MIEELRKSSSPSQLLRAIKCIKKASHRLEVIVFLTPGNKRSWKHNFMEGNKDSIIKELNHSNINLNRNNSDLNY